MKAKQNLSRNGVGDRSQGSRAALSSVRREPRCLMSLLKLGHQLPISPPPLVSCPMDPDGSKGSNPPPEPERHFC